jgi:hypothetical protein
LPGFIANAQSISYSLEIKASKPKSATVNEIIKNIDYKKSFNNKADVTQELNTFLFKLYDRALLTAAYDTIIYDSLKTIAYVHIGETYKWAKISKGNVNEGVISETGFREKIYYNKPVYYKDIIKLQERILIYCENNGFPFAQIKLDSVRIVQNKMYARLSLNKNTEVKVDSIVMKGNPKITPIYLYSYLSIKPGSTYNEQLVRQISNRIKELSFLREVKPFEVAFNEKNSKIYLYLENKKASQFDFVAGILPDAANAGKVQLTGDAHLKLTNSISHGEVVELNWKSPMPQTQDLKINLLYPFLFSTPFGLDINFSLYKKDTTYVDVVRNVGIQYILNGGNYLKIFINNKQSSLLNTNNYTNVTVLPPHADYSFLGYGLAYKSEKLDYRFNPRTGYSINLSGEFGQRTIQKIASLNNKNPHLYDDVQFNTTQYHLEYIIDYYFPIKNRSVIDAGVRGASQISPVIYQNEVYRIGGLKSLRGFDEESILATSYHYLKLEYRYILEQNSYLFAFGNAAYYENKSQDSNGLTNHLHDTPYGFGAGITFETKLGIFSFNYALGKQFDNPLYLRSGKIHFGIISYF